jgi:hypothetical protein
MAGDRGVLNARFGEQLAILAQNLTGVSPEDLSIGISRSQANAVPFERYLDA